MKKNEKTMKNILTSLILAFSLSVNIFSQIDSVNLFKLNIESAEKLIDLNFTDAERDSAQDNLKFYIKSYDVIHKIDLPNNIPPAILFNPIPVGYVNNTKQEKIKLDDYSKTVMPKKIDDLGFYSIGQMA